MFGTNINSSTIFLVGKIEAKNKNARFCDQHLHISRSETVTKKPK